MTSPSNSTPSDELLLQLVEEFTQRCQRGERVSLEEYCEQHPQLSSEIRQLFPALAVLEALGPEEKEESTPVGPDSLLPERIADYRIIAEIGRGGMGVVYEAEQQSLGRRVALKVLPSSNHSNSNSKLRFQQEARAAAKMHHTNIVPVFEVGEEENVVYYAMQLILGQSLDHVIDELKNARSGSHYDQLNQPGSSAGEASSASHESSAFRNELNDNSVAHRKKFYRSVARIGVQVADALAFAHGRGVIHRDVKPSNLLLDSDGVVWVTDFGLAKLDDEGLTQTGDFLGTLRYMSPERFQGKCDVRADIYALGLTLYELVLRRPAYESADRLKLIQLINHSAPIRPRQIDQRIPRDLETILLKSIEKEPRRRYKSARLLEQDLTRFLNDEPIQARRASLVEQTVRWSRKNPALASSLGALGIMAIVTVGVLLYSLRTTGAALERAKAAAAQSLREQSDVAFGNRRYQSAALLAHESREFHSTAAGDAKLQSARGSAPAFLKWASAVTDDATAIATSTTGNRFAAAFQGEKVILVWDTRSWQLEQRLNGHRGEVRSLVFAPDGERLFSASEDQTVCRWDLGSGQKRWSREFTSSLAKIAIDPAGSQLAVAEAFSHSITILQSESGAEKQRYTTQGGRILDLAFSEQGSLVAGVLDSGKVVLWDTSTNQAEVFPNINDASAARFVNSEQLAIGCRSGAVAIYNTNPAQKREQTRQIDSSRSPVTALAVDAEESVLAIGHENGELHLWSLINRKEVPKTSIRLHDAVTAVAIDSSGVALMVQVSHRAGIPKDARTLQKIDLHSGKVTAWTEGHAHTVTQLAFAEHGRRLVSASHDSTVQVWDRESGKNIHSFREHRGSVECLDAQREGDLVASGGRDKTLRLWDINSGVEVVEPRILTTHILGVAFHPQADTLASLTKDQINFWSVPTSGNQAKKTNHLVESSQESIDLRSLKVTPSPRTLRFSSDGKYLACGTTDGRVLIWSFPDQELLVEYVLEEDAQQVLNISSLLFSADGMRLAVSYGGYYARVLGIQTVRVPQVLARLEHQGLSTMSFSPDGNLLVTGGYQSDTRVWSVSTGLWLAHLEGHRVDVGALAFDRTGKYLASAAGPEVRLWEMQTSALTSINPKSFTEDSHQSDDWSDFVTWFDFSPDEKWMAAYGKWGGQNRVVLRENETGEFQDFRSGRGGAFDRTSNFFAFFSDKQGVQLLNLASKTAYKLDYPGGQMRHLDFNANGTLLVGGGYTEGIYLWDLRHQPEVKQISSIQGPVIVVFHPTDPYRLVTGSGNGKVMLWDLSQKVKKPERLFDRHSGEVMAIEFSWDGKYLATVGSEPRDTVLLWNAETGEIVQRFAGHTERTTHVALSRDGRWLATASDDRTVRLWNVMTGTEVRRFSEHTSHTLYVYFTRDGKRLASSSSDGSIYIRDFLAGAEATALSREQLEAQLGLRYHEGHIQPLPKRVLWHVEP